MILQMIIINQMEMEGEEELLIYLLLLEISKKTGLKANTKKEVERPPPKKESGGGNMMADLFRKISIRRLAIDAKKDIEPVDRDYDEIKIPNLNENKNTQKPKEEIKKPMELPKIEGNTETKKQIDAPKK